MRPVSTCQHQTHFNIGALCMVLTKPGLTRIGSVLNLDLGGLGSV
jgi:hypothetical protein